MKLRAGEWLMLVGSTAIVGFAVLAGVLVFERPDRLRFAYQETEQTAHGETVYRREGCNACHTIFGNGYAYGPSLDGVGSRRSADWLRRYMTAPWPGVSERRYRTEMPAYGALSDADMIDLVAYLQAVRSVDRDVEVLRP